jgi:hypothetical protein
VSLNDNTQFIAHFWFYPTVIKHESKNLNKTNDVKKILKEIFYHLFDGLHKQDRSKTCFKTAGKDWLLDCKVRLD